MKYRLIYTLALLMALPLVVQAQELHQWLPEQTDAREAAPDGLRKLHLTDKIANSPEGRQALADFHRRKALGLLPRAAKSTDALGDTLTFRVRNSTTEQTENIDFKLMAIDVADPPRFQIWVELAELNNELLDMEAIVRALAESTPPGSFDSNEGILVLDEQVFGDPPDVDGDGITDVLVLDIRDDFDEENNRSWLAGFVDGRDLSGVGNNRDVLYLDTEPTLRLRGIVDMEQTAAHEYQHLIHFNYDTNEFSFVNEGLSEWAEVLTGYQGRPITYLDDVDSYNVSFLRFSSEVFESIDDRERGAMFINYIADRFGEVNTGFITRQESNGTDGFRDALDSMQVDVSFEDLLFDFHIANFLNDTSLDARYGYTTEQRMGIQAAPAAFFDGRTASETPSTSTTVRPGAVQYLVWTQVKDFSITLNGLASLRAVALLFQGDSFEVRALNLDNTATTIDGEYDRIAVVVVNDIDPDVSTVSLAYSATWTVDQMVSITTIQYDDGQVATFPDGTGIFFLIGQTPNPNVALVTRFVVPFPERGTTLDKVLIAPFFSNQFSNPMGTPNDPRDFTFYVFGPGGDGEPGDIIFSQVFDDLRQFRSITSRTLDFIELDLSPFAAELTSLPDTIYVGYGEAGEATETVLVVGPSPYSVGNVSFIGNFTTGNWGPLWDVQFVGGDPEDFPVRETVLPVRAQFAVLTATAIDDLDEVPEAIVLYPNFPNPFNPTTAIRYALPQATEVRLAVYDLLGREVAVLVEGMKPPGEHQVQVDAGQWASGLYFYTIEADGQKRTQRMVLIK